MDRKTTSATNKINNPCLWLFANCLVFHRFFMLVIILVSMKKHVSTSVIIPVYNEKDYLERCLKALSEQTVKVDEIIVVDNNTTDGSVERAKKKYPDVTWLQEKTQGIVYARNKGFNSARGDILVKIDADSLVVPRWHEKMLADFEDSNIDAWTGYVDNNELNKLFQPVANAVFLLLTYQSQRLTAGCVVMFGSNMAIRKEAWLQIRDELNMRNDIWEDLDMSLELKNKGLNTVLSKYRGAFISARSSNTTLGVFYRRMLGQARVHYIRRRWLSVVLSFLIAQLSVLAWLVLRPLSYVGKSITKRPRPEQY